MRPLRIVFLVLATSFVLLSGCTKSLLLQVNSYDYTQLPYFLDLEKTSHKFKAELHIYDISLSGIMVAKRNENADILVSFVNEFGIKYFDAHLGKNNAEMIYCVKQLDKKIITNLLLHDLVLLFVPASHQQNIDEIELGNFTYKYTNAEPTLQLEEFAKNKRISTITLHCEGELSIKHTKPKVALILKPL